MTGCQRNVWIAAWLALCIVIVWYFFGVRQSRADDYPCPAGAKSCKIVVLTPEEERTLLDPIFPSAVWANRTLTDLIEQWKIKLQQAPAGKVVEAKPAPAKPETKK